MAMINMYTLHDVKAVTYNPPFPAGNHALAKRMVADLAADTATTVGRHPADFRLYCLGTYDDSKGRLEQFDMLEHVADVVSLVHHENMASLFDHNAPPRGAGSADERTNGAL